MSLESSGSFENCLLLGKSLAQTKCPLFSVEVPQGLGHPAAVRAPATAVHPLPKQAVRMAPARTSLLPGSSRTPEAEVVEKEEAWRLTVRALDQSPAPL